MIDESEYQEAVDRAQELRLKISEYISSEPEFDSMEWNYLDAGGFFDERYELEDELAELEAVINEYEDCQVDSETDEDYGLDL